MHLQLLWREVAVGDMLDLGWSLHCRGLEEIKWVKYFTWFLAIAQENGWYGSGIFNSLSSGYFRNLFLLLFLNNTEMFTLFKKKKKSRGLKQRFLTFLYHNPLQQSNKIYAYILRRLFLMHEINAYNYKKL